MSAPDNVFKGDKALIANVDIDAPLANAKAPCCDYYMSVFSVAAQHAAERGDVNGAYVYGTLNVIASFCPSFDTPAQPFVHFMRMEGKRGLIPSDLTPTDIEALRELSKVAKDP